MYRPGALSTFTVLCTHQPPFPELSHHPKEKTVPMKQCLPIPARHPCESLFNPRLYELAALDPSGEWHQAPRPLVRPTPFLASSSGPPAPPHHPDSARCWGTICSRPNKSVKPWVSAGSASLSRGRGRCGEQRATAFCLGNDRLRLG